MTAAPGASVDGQIQQRHRPENSNETVARVLLHSLARLRHALDRRRVRPVARVLDWNQLPGPSVAALQRGIAHQSHPLREVVATGLSDDGSGNPEL